MSDGFKVPPELIARANREREMGTHTRDEMVGHLWSSAEAGQARVFFVLDAHIIWETDQPRWHDLPLGAVSPDNSDPPGTGPRNILPHIRRLYGCAIPIQPIVLTDTAGSYKTLLEAIQRAQVIADSLSLVAREPVLLRPAKRMETHWSPDHGLHQAFDPPQGKAIVLHPGRTAQELTSTNVDDAWIDQRLRRFLVALAGIPDPDVRSILERAISWHAQANLLQGLGRYVHYWASIELLGSFFYEYLVPELVSRKSKAEIELEITKNLLSLNGDNYGTILAKCQKLTSTSSRDKILALSKVVLPSSDDMRHLLFDKVRDKGKVVAGARSMYDIRNDIAHGNVSELMRTYLDAHAERLDRFQATSGEFIVATLNRAAHLCANRRDGFTVGESSSDPD